MAEAELADVTVVIPTVGRQSLVRLLASLAQQSHLVGHVILVDDRPVPDGPVVAEVPVRLASRTRTLHSGGRGPAAARNVGWRASDSAWIAFLDDDVVASPEWTVDLRHDLAVASDVAAVQAQIGVPLPDGRRPTDRERTVAGLAGAPWITADMVVRRRALEMIAGFDERFPRAYREDSDLALRLQDRGWRLVRGHRQAQHPVQPAPWWVSVAAQRGNRDDALMLALHGRGWRPWPGRRARHGAITGFAIAAVILIVSGHRRLGALATLGWAVGTGEFAIRRIWPGPRTATEIAAMLATSVLIPPVAIAHWTAGRITWRPARTTLWDAHLTDV